MPQNIVSQMLRDGLYTRVVGRRIVHFNRLPSTMDEAARMAKEGAEEGTVVLADEQTAARGRFQRPWSAPPGNLYLSMVFRPSTRVLQYLSVISGVAVVRAIRNVASLRPVIKWPNDVQINGKKVCGILVEDSIRDNEVQHAIVGIGVNVALAPSQIDELAGIATGLNVEIGTEVEIKALLRHLLQAMDSLYVSLRREDGESGPDLKGPAFQQVMKEWRDLLETLGKRIEVSWGDEVYTGYAEDVNEAGHLLLRLDDGGLTTLAAGEVTFRVETSNDA